MLSVLASGGILMIPLGICAVIATFIICERLFYYRKIQKKDFILKEKIHPLVESHRFEEAVQLCNDTDTPLSS